MKSALESATGGGLPTTPTSWLAAAPIAGAGTRQTGWALPMCFVAIDKTFCIELQYLG
jgi:hypothetical protein